VWSATETEGYYEFTLKKVLITDGEDLTPPTYKDPWTPDPVDVPTGWVDYEANVVGTTFYPWSEDNSITENPNGSYTVSVITTASGYSTVTIPVDAGFATGGGIYVSVTLPYEADDGIKIRNFVTNPQFVTTPSPGGAWVGEIQTANHPDFVSGTYVTGRVDNLWDNSAVTETIKSIELALYWVSDTITGDPAPQYEFTINAIKVPDPEGYTPPDPWENFVVFAAGGTKTSGAIAANWNDTYNQAVFNFENGEGKLSEGGFYVSVTFGAASATNAARPERMLVTAYDSAGDTAPGWASQIIVPVTADTMDLYWDGGTGITTQYKKIEVIGQWDPATANILGKTLDVTFSAVKVTRLVSAGGPEPFPPTIKTEPADMTELTQAQIEALISNSNVEHTVDKVGDSYKVSATLTGTEFLGAVARFRFDLPSFDTAYLSFDFPETTGIRPTQVKVLAATNEWSGELGWPWFESTPDPNKYFGAQLDVSEKFAGVATSLIIYLYMSADTGDFEFTINKVSIKLDDE
jgi:hypothetical protein